MSPTPAVPLTIFVAHPSEVLTDHLPNGDGLVSFGFIRRLADRGHELHVAAQRVAVKAALPPNLHIYPLATNGGLSIIDRLSFMLRMRVLFERLRRRVAFDIVHQMNPVVTGLSLSLVGIRTPLVLGAFVPRWCSDADAEFTPSIGSVVRDALRGRIARLQQARADGLFVASPEALSRISQPLDHRDRIYEISFGIDLERFRERADVPGRPTVLFLANVVHRKGVFTLLEAFGQVAKVLPDAELVIAGDGGDLPEVRRRAAAMHGCRITVVGAVDRAQVPAVMGRHSVYCLPSYVEPFGMSLLEAMACGVPVVATRAGGAPDLLTEGGGRLVPPRDPDALAAALLEILTSVELQRAMGACNRARVEEVFEAERAVDRLERAYAAVLAKASPEPASSPGHARSIR